MGTLPDSGNEGREAQRARPGPAGQLVPSALSKVAVLSPLLLLTYLDHLSCGKRKLSLRSPTQNVQIIQRITNQ